MLSVMRFIKKTHNSWRVLPVIAQRQVGHIIQPLESLRADALDLIPGNEQIPRVPGDPGRDSPQVSGDTLHGVSRFGAFAARRARCVNGTEQRAKHDARHQVQHVGGGEGGEEKWDAQKQQPNQAGEDGMKRTISSSRTSLPCAVPTGNGLQLCICEQKCGREAGSDFHEDKSGGRARLRERVGGSGCLIFGCDEAGRRFFCNNEVKEGPSQSCDDRRGGASLLSGSSPRIRGGWGKRRGGG